MQNFDKCGHKCDGVGGAREAQGSFGLQGKEVVRLGAEVTFGGGVFWGDGGTAKDAKVRAFELQLFWLRSPGA